MRLKLGLAAGEETEETCIIVIEVQVENEAIVVGVLADAVCEVLDVRPEDIEPPPKLGTHLETKFIYGLGKVDEQFLILLDIDSVFSGDELAILEEAGLCTSNAESR